MRRRRTQFELLQVTTEFFLSVEDHNEERTARDVISGPPDFDSVVTGFSGIVFAQNGPVLVVFSLHFDSERSFRTSYTNGQLTRTGPLRVADEATLI